MPAFLENSMKIVAIDIETADCSYPCEIGVAEIADGMVINSKSWLVKPSCFPRMNPKHQAIHGIDISELESAPTFRDIWPELKPYIEGSLLIAHNAQFDIDCIAKEMYRFGIKTEPLRYCCTCEQSRRYLSLENNKLGSVCKYLGINIGKHHRAKDDAVAAAKIYLALPKTRIKTMEI